MNIGSPVAGPVAPQAFPGQFQPYGGVSPLLARLGGGTPVQQRPVDQGFGPTGLHPAVAGLLGAVLNHLVQNAKRGGVQDFNGPLTFHPTPHPTYSLLPVGSHGPAAY